jgi:tripartite-type tricarboxylate transporter receptor subunit TctC
MPKALHGWPVRVGARAALALILAILLTPPAGAASFPDRPIRLIVPFAPGGPPDVAARIIGDWLATHLGPVVVENHIGAGGTLAARLVAGAPPDGYTLMAATSGVIAISPQLYKNAGIDPVKDFTAVALLSSTPQVLAVNAALPVRSVKELVAYAKANPGKLSFASAGVGTASHMAGEMFKIMAGVDLVTVHYRGDGPAMIDLMGGQIQVGFATMTASIGQIRAGKLRPLAVTTTTRSPALPDLPTVADFVPGYEASSAFGVAAPAGTPAPIVATLNKEINAGLADSKVAARLDDMSGLKLTGTADDYGKFLADDAKKWAKVIHTAGIKAE